MKQQSRIQSVSLFGILLVLLACEQPSNVDGISTKTPGIHEKGNTERLVLNDTGVDFYQEHAIASSPYEIVPASPIKGSSAAPGQDADTGRDAKVADPKDGKLGFSFTKLDAITGAELPDDAPVWGCVRDNVSNLVWEVKTLSGEHAASNMYTWYEPDTTKNGGDPGLNAVEGDCGGLRFLKGNTHSFISNVNSFEQLCGFSDWRLPKREEFRTLVDYGVEQNWYINAKGRLTYEPVAYIDEEYFPNMLKRRHRWTVETSFNEPKKAWSFHPNDGRSEVHPKACTPGGNFTNGIMLVRSDAPR